MQRQEEEHRVEAVAATESEQGIYRNISYDHRIWMDDVRTRNGKMDGFVDWKMKDG